MSAKELNNILDRMETKRENYQDRSRIIPQYDGFRHEWSAYLEENVENIHVQ